MLNWLAFDPVSEMPVIVTGCEPETPLCVIVTGKVFVPLLIVPNDSPLGEMVRVPGVARVPVRLMLLGVTLAAVLVTDSVAFFVPEEDGEKVTFTVVDWPWFSVIVLEKLRLKWLAWVPPIEIAVIEMADEPTGPVCVSVIGRVFVPLLIVPKSSGLGEMLSVACGLYVPVRLTLVGVTVEAVLVTDSVAALAPAEVGEKVTSTVTDWP